MLELFYQVFPTLEKAGPEFIKCTIETIQMVLYSGIISFIFGLIFGVILIVTNKGGILQNKVIYNILDKIINVTRSVPYLILMILVIPYSRIIVGTGIGVIGAIVPLVIGTIPFFSRQIESAIAQVDKGLIEAAQAMGSSPFDIIIGVYLKESIPSIVRVTMTTAVNLIGLTAMAGAIGAGGLGDFAIRYGHQRGFVDITWATVVVILIMVTIIQAIGNLIIKKTTH